MTWATKQTASFQRVMASDLRESILAHEGVTVQSLRWWQLSEPGRPVGCGHLPLSRGLPSYIYAVNMFLGSGSANFFLLLSFHWGYLCHNPFQEGRPPVSGVELSREWAPHSSRPCPSSRIRPLTARHSQGLSGRHLCTTNCQACAPWTTTTEGGDGGAESCHVRLLVTWPAHLLSPAPHPTVRCPWDRFTVWNCNQIISATSNFQLLSCPIDPHLGMQRKVTSPKNEDRFAQSILLAASPYQYTEGTNLNQSCIIIRLLILISCTDFATSWSQPQSGLGGAAPGLKILSFTADNPKALQSNL